MVRQIVNVSRGNAVKAAKAAAAMDKALDRPAPRSLGRSPDPKPAKVVKTPAPRP